MHGERELVLVVDDAPDTVEVLRRNLELQGYVVATAGGVAEALSVLDERSVDLVITDLRMPGASGLDLIRHVAENHRDTQVLMITGYPSVETAVSAVRSGAVNYLAKPFTDEELGNAVGEAMEGIRARRALQQRRGTRPAFRGVIGESLPMRGVYELMDKASRSKVGVLLRGETGTGKDLLARAIHYRSDRAKGPFVHVACAVIPPDRLESELFGWTGDKSHRSGLIRAAQHGSIYLDEITALSPDLQARIGRWIESGRISVDGEKRAMRVDARVFASTRRDIQAMARAGTFEKSLLYQVAVVEIEVPPLRARGHDIALLARAFAQMASKEMGCDVPSFSDRALAALHEHAWPGNVRELSTLIQRLVVLNDGDEIDVPDLPTLLRFSAMREPDETRTLEAVEAQHIRKVLGSLGGNQSRAAEVLGIDRKTLRAKLRRSEKR